MTDFDRGLSWGVVMGAAISAGGSYLIWLLL